MASKYVRGQKLRIGIHEGDGDARRFVVREAVVESVRRLYSNNSTVRLRFDAEGAQKEMEVWSTTLTKLVRMACE